MTAQRVNASGNTAHNTFMPQGACCHAMTAGMQSCHQQNSWLQDDTAKGGCAPRKGEGGPSRLPSLCCQLHPAAAGAHDRLTTAAMTGYAALRFVDLVYYSLECHTALVVAHKAAALW